MRTWLDRAMSSSEDAAEDSTMSRLAEVTNACTLANKWVSEEDKSMAEGKI